MNLEKQLSSGSPVKIVMETVFILRTDILPIEGDTEEPQAFIAISTTKEVGNNINRL